MRNADEHPEEERSEPKKFDGAPENKTDLRAKQKKEQNARFAHILSRVDDINAKKDDESIWKKLQDCFGINKSGLDLI